MATDRIQTRPIRRRSVLAAGAGTALFGLAGCFGLGGPGAPESTPTETAVAGALTPAPTGRPLSSAAVDRLVAAFDDQPFGGGQDTPSHVWKWVNDRVLLFLHFDSSDPREASALRYVGVGVAGRFTAADRPDPVGGSFTHFHRFDSPTWEGGHGGRGPDDEGVWLTHVAVDDFEMPWGRVGPGVDYGFMPTPPPAGSGTSSDPPVTHPDAGPLTSAAVRRVVETFDDQPFAGGQATPSHVWHWVNEETFVFLHWDAADVREATALRYVGVGVRGHACADERPHVGDFTHFHKWHSETWPGGHGGAPNHHGYWLVHVAADEFEMPWGPVTPGVDRAFMPTPPAGGCEHSGHGAGARGRNRDGSGPASGSEGVSDPGPSSTATTVRLVSTSDPDRPFAFDPSRTTVPAGTTVRWVNVEDVFHTVTSTETLDTRRPSGLFDATLAGADETFAHRFDEPGTYHYYCRPHVGFMVGTISVRDKNS